MARIPADKGDPYVQPVLVKMNNRTLALLDALRGDIPRSTYLRGLLESPKRDNETDETPSDTDLVAARAAIDGSPRHLHRYKQGPVVGYDKGKSLYLRECACGATKTD